MFATYWTISFLGLFALHYSLLPRVVPAPLGGGYPAAGAATAPQLSYCVWVGSITAAVFVSLVGSWLMWHRTGYLGTLFFVASGYIWTFRWLSGAERDPAEIRLYDSRLTATLVGCIVGSLLAWLVGQL